MNFGWRYHPVFSEAQLSPAFNDSQFQCVDLPHVNRELPFSHFDESASQFISCYRKRFRIPASQQGQRFMLHFEGAMTVAEVFLNGRAVGSHKGGYTPFQLDITDALRFGPDNVLVVKVDSREREDIPPFGHVVDYLPYGGIYREVWLESLPPVFVGGMKISPHRVFEGEWMTEVTLFWENHTGAAVPVHLTAHLSQPDVLATAAQSDEAAQADEATQSGTSTQCVIEKPHLVPAERTSISTHAFVTRGVRCWDINTPVQYQLSVAVSRQDEPADRVRDTFGFREAVFRADGFYLNGKRVKLRGLNRHQSFPHVGYAMPKTVQQRDADILKHELGVNLVRSSHYPPSRHFLDRCDALGLLVFEEIPGWQHIGDASWKQVAIKNTEEMIRRDWNHPSIILWGVRINESGDDDTFYQETNRLAHALDATRQTGGVRNFAGSHLFEDVYTFNDFSHHGSSVALQNPRRVTRQPKSAGQLREVRQPGTIRRRFRKIPYLVTEHNGHMFPTKVTDPEARRTEHALRHLRVLDAMYRHPRISGAIGWCMADYNTHRDFGSGDRICHHGVLDMYRLPKTAAAVYASQQEARPVLAVSSTMNIGDHDAAALPRLHVFTNCDTVRMYRNEELIGTFSPDHRHYPGVPHPPVVIEDFIGDRLERREGFNHRDAEAIKRTLRAVMATGGALSLSVRIAMGWQMLKHHLSYEQAVELFGKYVGNWGGKSLVWRFEGLKAGKPVLAVEAGAAPDGSLRVLPDRRQLHEDVTWDACRVVLRHLDGYGNLCVYSKETVQLEVTGAGMLIGPACLPLTGGATAFWVKTIGQHGDIQIRVRNERYGDTAVTLTADTSQSLRTK
jgi:beta-galactosidase